MNENTKCHFCHSSSLNQNKTKDVCKVLCQVGGGEGVRERVWWRAWSWFCSDLELEEIKLWTYLHSFISNWLQLQSTGTASVVLSGVMCLPTGTVGRGNVSWVCWVQSHAHLWRVPMPASLWLVYSKPADYGESTPTLEVTQINTNDLAVKLTYKASLACRTLKWQLADFRVVLTFDLWRISSFNSQGRYFPQWQCLFSRLIWELVSACPYITGQHWHTASQHTGHTESTFSLSLPIGLLTFYPHFSMNNFSHPFSWVLIMSAVVNSVFSPQDQGRKGIVAQSRPFSWDCRKVKNEPYSSTYFFLGHFNERTREDGARYSIF